MSLVFKAYHLRREETDWFDKPRESHLENGHDFDRRLPDKLAHSRPPSQHQDQVRRLFFNEWFSLTPAIHFSRVKTIIYLILNLVIKIFSCGEILFFKKEEGMK